MWLTCGETKRMRRWRAPCCCWSERWSWTTSGRPLSTRCSARTKSKWPRRRWRARTAIPCRWPLVWRASCTRCRRPGRISRATSGRGGWPSWTGRRTTNRGTWWRPFSAGPSRRGTWCRSTGASTGKLTRKAACWTAGTSSKSGRVNSWAKRTAHRSSSPSRLSTRPTTGADPSVSRSTPPARRDLGSRGNSTTAHTVLSPSPARNRQRRSREAKTEPKPIWAANHAIYVMIHHIYIFIIYYNFLKFFFYIYYSLITVKIPLLHSILNIICLFVYAKKSIWVRTLNFYWLFWATGYRRNIIYLYLFQQSFVFTMVLSFN